MKYELWNEGNVKGKYEMWNSNFNVILLAHSVGKTILWFFWANMKYAGADAIWNKIWMKYKIQMWNVEF